MIKVFDKVKDFEDFSYLGMKSGNLYYVTEDKSVHFKTNNIDGIDKEYNIGVGNDIVPEGNIAIIQNGENIDVTEYATASVNVPIPDGYIVPSGSTTITENGENIDIAQYATITVNVAAPTPEYTAVNLNTFTVDSYGHNFSTMITATLGQTIEVYNPNHLIFSVGQGGYLINPSTGDLDAPSINQNGISSYDNINDNYLEHLYVTNAPNTMEGSYSDYGFYIGYYSQAGTAVDGVIYYRIIGE